MWIQFESKKGKKYLMNVSTDSQSKDQNFARWRRWKVAGSITSRWKGGGGEREDKYKGYEHEYKYKNAKFE